MTYQGSMSGMSQGSGQDVKDEVRQKGEQAVEQVKQTAGDTMEKARESTRAALDQQKGRAAEGLGSVASALRTTGQQLNDQDQAAIGQYAQRAAEKVDTIASQLREKNVEELVYEAERFARREPELFLGGAVVLGLLAARFLKASNSRRQYMRDADWQRSYGGPGGVDYRGYETRPYGTEYGGQRAGQQFSDRGFAEREYSSLYGREEGFVSGAMDDTATEEGFAAGGGNIESRQAYQTPRTGTSVHQSGERPASGGAQSPRRSSATENTAPDSDEAGTA